MKTIFYFNPETDYALASDSPAYTAPPKVVEVRHRLELCQLPCASRGDVILIDSLPSEDSNTLRNSDEIRIIPISESAILLKEVLAQPDVFRLQPWGWNRAVKRFFLKLGFPESLLPADSTIQNLRNLSHRRTTIQFNRLLNEYMRQKGYTAGHCAPLPLEFSNPEDAMTYLSKNSSAFVKAPWSSSGRGVIFAASMSAAKTEEWIRGIIRRQGSVMIEEAADKKIDFATEWYISGGNAEYLGLSLFRTSPEGKYGKNINLPQDEMLREIQSVAPDFDNNFINLQKRTLEEISKGYEGYAGIDMLADTDGNIRGCIEINFRMTMGIVSLFTQLDYE